MQNSKCNVSSLKKKKTEKPHKRYRIISLIFTKYPIRLFAKRRLTSAMINKNNLTF